MLSTVEQVSPVVRPLLATDSVFRFAAVSTSPVPAAGGAAPIWLLPPPAAPRARMAPLASTLLELVAASAASTLAAPAIGTQYWSVPTAVMPLTPEPSWVQPVSTSPGWMIVSPDWPWSESASTWLLLRM